ncbi:MAG TPA: DUF1653 domain-containing protein [Candidatus Paceibacterota bacterium]|nr:DUF1653 domain-containing protein [Candidatus Paceibacterota bacterium]
MPKKVPELGFYYHSGSVNNYAYEVIGVGFHTEDDARPGEEHFVVYRPLYAASVYEASKKLGVPCFDIRPLEMRMGEVEKEGERIPRFQRITDPRIIAELEKIRNRMY